jgi:LacI family transcriptional regulator
VNLKQLSHMLSLSQTTVSRALNGYPEVSEETRRRVMDAAKRHGYRPNPSARRLATGKAGMIGYVMPTGAAVDIDPHFVEFLSGLGDYARSHDLDLVLSPTAADEEETTYRRIVANRSTPSMCRHRGLPTGEWRCSTISAFPTSSMDAPKGWTSTIRSSISTTRRPSTKRRGC